MKAFYAISLDILNCDPTCVEHHLLPACFNNSGTKHYCRIKRDVDKLKFKPECRCRNKR